MAKTSSTREPSASNQRIITTLVGNFTALSPHHAPKIGKEGIKNCCLLLEVWVKCTGKTNAAALRYTVHKMRIVSILKLANNSCRASECSGTDAQSKDPCWSVQSKHQMASNGSALIELPSKLRPAQGYQRNKRVKRRTKNEILRLAVPRYR